MPFDLYGNSYTTEREALNAEMAQCAEIDASIAERNSRELRELMDTQYYQEQEREQNAELRLLEIESRIAALEAFLPISICEGEAK